MSLRPVPKGQDCCSACEGREERWQRAKAESFTLLGRVWDESLHPRDEGGKFGSGGGGASESSSGPKGEGKPKGKDGKHPGKGYSKDAVLKDGVIHTPNVEDAARALGENKKVELDQPRKVSVLLKKLGEVSKEMIAKGQKAPTYNLCNVSVSGTNLFCVGNKGIPRVQMPQMDDDQTKAFRKHLKEKGYSVDKEDTPASHLRATQNELNGAKVSGIAADLRNKPDHYAKRIIVSKDDYILDGHHHWAAKVGLDAEDGSLTNDTPVKIARVDISITKLLEEAEKFTGGKGKKDVKEEGTSKSFKSLGSIVAAYVNERLLHG